MNSAEKLTVYWQPGCSSCLRTKEFLTRHGVAFVSVDVMADADGFAALEKLGVRQVPVVRRGAEWVDGQILRDVARFVGIDAAAPAKLPPEEIVRRLDRVITASQASLRQMPDALLDRMLPDDRPQTHRQLACHVVQIVEAFLNEAEHGRRLEFADYAGVLPPGVATRDDLLAFGDDVRARLAAWWTSAGVRADWDRRARVYYGEQTLHEFLERTGWHAAQHTRQLAYIVEQQGLRPEGRLTSADLAGLPVPSAVWS